MKKYNLIFLFLIAFTQIAKGQELFLPEYIITAQKTHISVEWAYYCGGSDISYFVIERSKDGNNADSLATYPLICLTNGGLTHYSFADSTPLSGLSYYRIKAYSALYDIYYYEVWQKVIFQANANIFFQANPNPVEDKIRLIWYKPTQSNVSAILYDVSGNVVRVLVNEIFMPGTKVLDIKENIATIPQGVYYLKATIGENTFQTTLIKK